MYTGIEVVEEDIRDPRQSAKIRGETLLFYIR